MAPRPSRPVRRRHRGRPDAAARRAHELRGRGRRFHRQPRQERYAREYPTLQVSLCPTSHEGERGFSLTLFEQSSYGSRELGNDWTGNSVYLWAVVNAAYMSLLGPAGFAELGELILMRSHYAASRIAGIPGVAVRWPGFFKEFVVDFNGLGRTVAEVNAALRGRSIFGGGDLSRHIPSSVSAPSTASPRSTPRRTSIASRRRSQR